MRTPVNRPMGRFAWTNHFYFEITGSGTVPVNFVVVNVSANLERVNPSLKDILLNKILT